MNDLVKSLEGAAAGSREPTIGKMLATNLADALSGKITPEEAQRRADEWAAAHAEQVQG